MASMPDYFSIATLKCRGIPSIEKVSGIYQTTKDLEIVCLQETYFKDYRDSDLFDRVLGKIFKIFHSFIDPNNMSTGVTFLFKRDCPISQIVMQLEIQGRALGFSMAIGHFTLLVVGLYAPAVDGERAGFFTSLTDKISMTDWFGFGSFVVLGDFNFVEKVRLDRSSNTRSIDRQVGLQEFLFLKELMSIHDVYRKKHPDTNDFFTYRSATYDTLSRLDRTYASVNMCLDALCTTRSVKLSDHRLFRVKFNLKLSACKRGKGYYKMNTLLLSEDGVDNFVVPRLQNILQNPDFSLVLWEVFKLDVKHYFQKLGKYKAKKRNLDRQSIESSIRRTELMIATFRDPGDKFILKSLLKRQKSELDNLNNYYLANCRHNTYYKDYVEDKISFSNAKSLQRKDWEQRHLYSIQENDGNLVTEPDQILEVVRHQYESLFISEGISYPTLRHFLRQENFPKLDNVQSVSLEQPFSPDEVKDALRSMQGNKTPGLDSIPIEFYWRFSSSIAIILSEMFNSIFLSGVMHNTAYIGIISLLYKGSGERSLRENWRPLTLLNVDYKIFAKVLAKRLEKVMVKLVHPDQTSSVPGRTIRDSLCHVMSVVDYAKYLGGDAMILSVDHQAAFDMVEWDFIFETLKMMNVGPLFLKLVKSIYCENHVFSAVNVNGFISNFFSINRGIRQGCPLSPLIYVITSEVLSHYVRGTTMLRGIPLCGSNNRITKYADDTSLFVSSWQEIDNIFRIFDLYKLASGSRLKNRKTQLLLLGNLKNAVVPQKYTPFVVKKLKLYGFFVTADGLDDEQNWEKCNNTADRLARRLPPFGVSLFGKMHFVHLYYLCMFNYLVNVITPPVQLVERTQNAIIRFYGSRPVHIL
jgi:hypothetical protein